MTRSYLLSASGSGHATPQRRRGLVPHTGFEPVISALRGRCPGPLDECGAGRRVGTATTADRIPNDADPVARAIAHCGVSTYNPSTATVGRPLVPSAWILRVCCPSAGSGRRRCPARRKRRPAEIHRRDSPAIDVARGPCRASDRAGPPRRWRCPELDRGGRAPDAWSSGPGDRDSSRARRSPRTRTSGSRRTNPTAPSRGRFARKPSRRRRRSGRSRGRGT